MKNKINHKIDIGPGRTAAAISGQTPKMRLFPNALAGVERRGEPGWGKPADPRRTRRLSLFAWPVMEELQRAAAPLMPLRGGEQKRRTPLREPWREGGGGGGGGGREGGRLQHPGDGFSGRATRDFLRSITPKAGLSQLVAEEPCLMCQPY